MKKSIDKLLNIDILDMFTKKNMALLDTLFFWLKEPDNHLLFNPELVSLLNQLIEKYELKILALRGTPFLWNAIFSLIKNFSDDFYIDKSFNIIVLHLLDSYCDLMPDFDLSVTIKEKFAFSFSKLNIQVPFASGNALINKRDSTIFITVGEDIYKCDTGRKSLCEHDIRVLTDAAALLPQNIIADIHDHELYEAAVNKALHNIKTVDLELYKDINKLIKFIIPIEKKGININDTSISFSLEDYIGLIFASYTSNSIWLSETIIHEYGHNLLSSIMDFYPLIKDVKSNLYYSPWRNDPRPLSGLLHGLFVFTYVVNFLDMCLKSSSFYGSGEFIINRLNIHLYRLKAGFAQINSDTLTDYGKLLFNIVQESFERIAKQHIAYRPYPDNIIKHFQQWETDNPALNAIPLLIND